MKGDFAMAIDTYEYRKAHGLCIRCGRELTGNEKAYVTCLSCRARLTEHTKNYRTNKEEVPVIMHSSTYIPPTYSLSDVVKMAMANGLSYGNMVAVLDGKTTLRRSFHYSDVTKISPNHGE